MTTESPYYLRAFIWTLQEAISRPKFSSLLHQSEIDLITKFFSLDPETQRFYVRLFMRRSRHSFHTASLIDDYKQEFPSIQDLIANCGQAGFIEEQSNCELIVKHCLTKAQLDTLHYEMFSLKSGNISKGNLVEKIMSFHQEKTGISKPALQQTKLFVLPSKKIGFNSDTKRINFVVYC